MVESGDAYPRVWISLKGSIPSRQGGEVVTPTCVFDKGQLTFSLRLVYTIFVLIPCFQSLLKEAIEICNPCKRILQFLTMG